MIIADLYITAARGCQILALLLCAYLLACGVNAAYERLRDFLSRRRRL